MGSFWWFNYINKKINYFRDNSIIFGDTDKDICDLDVELRKILNGEV